MPDAPPTPENARKRRRAQRRAERKHETAERSLKETLESVVLAFILAFTFRAYVLEAYIIPTGSMAPTLLGGHVEVLCDRCGHPVIADAAPLRDRPRSMLRCPMCFFETPLEAGPGLPPAVHAGDRILVQKYLGSLATPRRYDVVVFKNPQNPFGRGQNFIKRLAGLPGERLMLLDGNVYAAAEPAPGATRPARWRIARKTDERANPRAEAIQRDVFQPVFHGRYTPEDGGADGRWAPPWRPSPEAWQTARNRWTTTNHPADGGPARLTFDFTPIPGRPGYLRSTSLYPYNQTGFGPGDLNALEDFRLAVTIGGEAASTEQGGPEVRLAGLTRLDGGPVEVRARFAPSGVYLETRGPGTADPWERLAASAAGVALPEREHRPRLEFWVVDQELSAWIDGRRVARHRVDLSLDELLARPAPPQASEQELTVEVAGGDAGGTVLTDLDLDRDLFHHAGGLGRFRGGVNRTLNGGIPESQVRPVRLAADEFFLMGDNSPQSDDSRRWSTVDPWIRGRYFAGTAGEEAAGRVPRGLLIGRAFAVYYPAARPLRPGGAAVVPDLTRMRWIR